MSLRRLAREVGHDVSTVSRSLATASFSTALAMRLLSWLNDESETSDVRVLLHKALQIIAEERIGRDTLEAALTLVLDRLDGKE